MTEPWVIEEAVTSALAKCRAGLDATLAKAVAEFEARRTGSVCADAIIDAAIADMCAHGALLLAAAEVEMRRIAAEFAEH